MRGFRRLQYAHGAKYAKQLEDVQENKKPRFLAGDRSILAEICRGDDFHVKRQNGEEVQVCKRLFEEGKLSGVRSAFFRLAVALWAVGLGHHKSHDELDGKNNGAKYFQSEQLNAYKRSE